MDLLLTLLLYGLGFILLLILTQDINVFPGAFISKLQFFRQRNKRIPPAVESVFIESIDGIKLELWRYEPEVKTELSDYKAIIVHGNGGPVENFIFAQMWLAEQGISSYSFDYRGYGRSSGWPSEKGIYKDSDAVWQYVTERENIESRKVIIVGISIGSGAAARIAAREQPALLLLCSAFTDFRSVVRAQPLIGLLAPFVWTKFPTVDYVAGLESCSLLLAHSVHDRFIPLEHSEQLEAAYKGSGRVKRFVTDEAGHNLTLYALKDEIATELATWLH